MFLVLVLGLIVVLLLGGLRLLVASPAFRAATDLYKASTLTDGQVEQIARKYVAWADRENNLLPPDHSYTKRLLALSEGFYNPERYDLRVYATGDVNAFACADGSIRVFSGLMDRMTDEELLAIIGHEMGHIVHRDTLRAMRNAYMASAARNAISATGGAVGNLTGSAFGDMALKLTGAKFSRNQEYAADDYAFRRTVQYGADPFSVADALEKLAALAAGEAPEPSAGTCERGRRDGTASGRSAGKSTADRTSQRSTRRGAPRANRDQSVSARLGSMFSTHPDPAGRAARMCARAGAFVRKYPEYYGYAE